MNVLIVDDEDDPRIRVIVLTASTDPADHLTARSFGATEVYTKPYDLEELARAIAATPVTAAAAGASPGTPR